MYEILSFIIWLGVLVIYNYLFRPNTVLEPFKCEYFDNITLCE